MANKPNHQLGIFLRREILNPKKLTQKAFAELIEVSPAFVNYLMTGQRKLSKTLARKIAERTDVSFEELMAAACR